MSVEMNMSNKTCFVDLKNSLQCTNIVGKLPFNAINIITLASINII